MKIDFDLTWTIINIIFAPYTFFVWIPALVCYYNGKEKAHRILNWVNSIIGFSITITYFVILIIYVVIPNT